MEDNRKRLLVNVKDSERLKRFSQIEGRTMIKELGVILAWYESVRPELWDNRDRQNIRRMLLEGD